MKKLIFMITVTSLVYLNIPLSKAGSLNSCTYLAIQTVLPIVEKEFPNRILTSVSVMEHPDNSSNGSLKVVTVTHGQSVEYIQYSVSMNANRDGCKEVVWAKRGIVLTDSENDGCEKTVIEHQ